MNKNRLKIKVITKLKVYSILTIGSILMAAGVSLFLLPNELSTGGFAGIATRIFYLFNLPVRTKM